MTTSFFIRYLFEAEIVRKQIFKAATGQTRYGLKRKNWEPIKIPLPPLIVQEKIVEILDKFDALAHSLGRAYPLRSKHAKNNTSITEKGF